MTMGIGLCGSIAYIISQGGQKCGVWLAWCRCTAGCLMTEARSMCVQVGPSCPVHAIEIFTRVLAGASALQQCRLAFSRPSQAIEDHSLLFRQTLAILRPEYFILVLPPASLHRVSQEFNRFRGNSVVVGRQTVEVVQFRLEVVKRLLDRRVVF